MSGLALLNAATAAQSPLQYGTTLTSKPVCCQLCQPVWSNEDLPFVCKHAGEVENKIDSHQKETRAASSKARQLI